MQIKNEKKRAPHATTPKQQKRNTTGGKQPIQSLMSACSRARGSDRNGDKGHLFAF